VVIVLAVAGHATDRCILESRAAMAGLALKMRMPTEKREPRQSVVEQGMLPRLFIVTIPALLAFLSLVYVVSHMTTGAGHWRLEPAEICEMAGFAAQQPMGAQQGKAGAIVVKAQDLPGSLGVATVAILPESSMVAVIASMAAIAQGR
jgi:hypothetical protein